MSTGTRTILLSRWRSGGQTSLDLVREFTQELPHTTPADAWQRAVQVVSNSPLNLEAEPRHQEEVQRGACRQRRGPAGHAPVFLGRLPAGRLRQSRPRSRSKAAKPGEVGTIHSVCS